MRQHARLTLTTRPSLRLSPGVQLGLELLQSPALELKARIEREALANPLLELLDDDDAPSELEHGTNDGRGTGECDGDAPAERSSSNDDSMQPSEAGDVDADGSEWPDANEWNVAAAPRGVLETIEMVDRDRRREPPFQEMLLEQLRLEHCHPLILEQATYLIGCLDERGYLGFTLEQIGADLQVDPQCLEVPLRAVQQLDPPGIGARDLRECLLLQLRRNERSESLAGRILEDAFDLLASRRYGALMRRFRADDAALESAIREIRRLDPCPGRALGSPSPEYLIPDLVVTEVGDGLEIRLGEESSPKLRIDPRYRTLANESNEPAVAEFLRGRLRSARWLMHALDRRRLTMIQVTQSIVEAQRGFFTEGAHALRPLTLREIADKVGLHESTVARVTKDKYVETPRGIFPLKFFFSSRISTESGTDTSARAVKVRIRELVENEQNDQPLSDEAIVRCLEQEGIRIARRTVAKYRDQMRIARAQFRRSRVRHGSSSAPIR